MDRTSSAGLLGRYYSVGHVNKTYLSCAASGVYNVPTDLLEKITSIELLKYALAKTISRHPTLCYGIIDKTEKTDVHFLQLQTINWEDVVEVKRILTSENRDDGELCKEVGRGHELLFEDQNRKPAWRIIVLIYENEPTRIDVIYYNHHAIGDGTSCVAFHKTLIQYLQEGSSLTNGARASWPYVVPEKIGRPVFVEDALPLPSESGKPTLHIPKEESVFKPWTAASPSVDPFRSLATILTVPQNNVSHILKYCRQRNITLTGLLHGLITIHLSKSIPSAQGFQARTPVSMRRFTKISDDEIVNHVSSVLHQWTQTLLSSIRTSVEGSVEEEQIICQIAAQYQTDVAEELIAIPKTGSAGLLEISQISDYEAVLKEIFKKRSMTYELSNVGLVKLTVDTGNDEVVQLEKVAFSQCGMVTGPAFGVSGVSIAGGPLCLCVSWQEGILEEGFAVELKAYLERRLLAFI